MHLLLILLLALVVFGPKKLPEIDKGLGEAIRGFRKAFDEGASEPTKPAQITRNQEERKIS